MTDAPDTVAISEGLLRKLGLGSVSLVRGRAAECRRSGDAEGAEFWTDVAAAMEAAAAARGLEPASVPDGKSRAPRPASVLWQLMQRIEDYRHRAMLAEQRAAERPPATRDELLEISREWRDLATRAELLAEWALDGRTKAAR